MINVNVKAEGTGDMTYEEGAKVYVPTEAEKKHAQAKEFLMLNTPTAQTASAKTLEVTCYPQEKSYYCGPATVQQVLHFLLGENYTQDYYAQKLGTTKAGTDFSKITNFVNGRLGTIYYDFVPLDNINSWYSRIRWDTNNGYPVFLDINTENVEGIPYSVTGHIVNTSGYDEEGEEDRVQITDPYQEAVGNKWYSKTELYKANDDHFLKRMIW